MVFNNIHKCYLARFFTSLHFFGGIVIPYTVDWLQVDYLRIFLLQAWFSLWVAFFEIPTGIIADKYGRRTSLLLGSMLFVADIMIFGLTRNYHILYLAEFLGAIGVAMISGIDKAFVYDSLIELGREADARHYLSRYDAVGTVGIVLSLPLGSLIVESGIVGYPRSLAFTFVLSGAASIIALLLYAWMREPERHVTSDNFVEMGLAGLKKLREHAKLRAIALNSVIISSLTFFMFWLYQPLTGLAGFSIKYYGFVGAGFNLFAVVLLMNLKRIESIISVRRILFLTGIIPGVLYVSLVFSKNALFVLPSIFLVAGFKLLRAPILSDYMNKHIESRQRATVLSSVSLMERASIFILYPVVGLLADLSIDHALLFLGLLTVFFAIVGRVEEKHLS
ncbi:MAG: MFS transporter [Candidatus Altiarchaeota archaeon]